MAGTYSYLKVAKMKLIDGSSNLVITANAGSGVAFATNRLTADKLNLPSTAALHWNDPRNPIPNNSRSIFDTSGNISTGNVTAGNLTVGALESFGNLTITSGGLVDSSNFTANIFNSTSMTSGGAANLHGITAGSFSGRNILLGSSTLVDLSGNVNTNGLIVSGNATMVNGVDVIGNIYTGGNASVSLNASVLQNKSIANSVFIGNALQMLDSSGNNLFLTGPQLKLLLALI